MQNKPLPQYLVFQVQKPCRKKKSAASNSARPTIDATASVCMGCTANTNAATHATSGPCGEQSQQFFESQEQQDCDNGMQQQIAQMIAQAMGAHPPSNSMQKFQTSPAEIYL